MQKDGDQNRKTSRNGKRESMVESFGQKKGVFRKLQLAGIETVASNLSDK